MIVALAFMMLAEPSASNATAAPSTSWRLDEIKRELADLKCDKLAADAQILAHDITLSDDDHRAVLFAEGYCDVVVGNDNDAAKIFAELVHENIDFKPGIELPDRISDRLEGARARERKARDDDAAAARQKIKDSVKLVMHPPLNLTGGSRAIFYVDATDANHVIKSMRIDFVKEGEREPYGVPMYLTKEGRWRGEIAGTYTRTHKPSQMKFFITASDDVGELASIGTKQNPRVLDIATGYDAAVDLKPDERLPFRNRVFYAAAGTPVIATTGFALSALASENLVDALLHRLDAKNNKLDRIWPQLSVGLFALLPPAVALIVVGSGTDVVLGDEDVVWPVSAVGVALSLWVAGIIVGNLDDFRMVRDISGSVNNAVPTPGSAPQADSALPGFALAGAGAALGLLAAIAVPTTLVLVENASAEPTESQPQTGEKSVR